jgi:hypothetical protein
MNRLFSIVILLTIFSMIQTTQLFAQGEANIFLKQTASTTPDQMTIEVVISDVADLYGAEVRLRYDPLILQPVDTDPNQQSVQVEPGSFLSPEQSFVVANQVDETHGTIAYAVTMLNPAPPATGQGVLLRIPFNVLRPNESNLNVEHVKLVAHSLETIPVQSQGLSFGTAPALTEEEARTELALQDNIWWVIAGGVILAVGLGLMTVVIIARRNAQ